MKLSEIYQNAARDVFSKKCSLCCAAILINVDKYRGQSLPEIHLLANFFKPGNSDFWWFGDPCNDNNQEHRVLSLLLMAEIVKTEGPPNEKI